MLNIRFVATGEIIDLRGASEHRKFIHPVPCRPIDYGVSTLPRYVPLVQGVFG